MLGKKTAKMFSGALGSGLPVDDFESAIDKPESVRANLDNLRPMILAIRDMAQMKGWQDYIKPFLEKNSDASKLLELIKKKEDATFEAAKIEAFKMILNQVNSMVRTAESLKRMAAEAPKEEE